MSTIEKLIERFKQKPSDFTYNELIRLMNYLNYQEDTKGATSGSRIKFFRDTDNKVIMIHKPHNNILKDYQMNQLIQTLSTNGDI